MMDSADDPDFFNRYLSRLNYTDRVEIECQLSLKTWVASQAAAAAAAVVAGQPGIGSSSCGPDFDTVDCWPASEAGTLVVKPCFEELHGIKYDTKGKRFSRP